MSFKGKSVLITGASSGIGAGTAIFFVKEGANVAIVGRKEDKLKNVAAELNKYVNGVLVIKADVSNENEAKTIVKQTVEKFGKLDVLVNNAGIVRFRNILDDNILQVYDEVMNTNMRAVVQITYLAAPYLIETKGNIINVSSISGRFYNGPGFVSYCTSKAALDHFTRCVASELAPKGVRVNAVNPGPVVTDIIENAGLRHDQLWNEWAKKTALGRISEISEIADLIGFLACDKARGITGSTYVTDNGALVKPENRSQ